MATTTMNGWSLTGVPLATITAGGRSTQVRAGAVATVLGHVARRFHAEVEPLVTFHGWRSVATNAAVGGHPRSNHPSGTAIDNNGGKHPRYRHGTFTAAQVAVIRRILADCGGVVRWGGDWGADVDAMHFEIVGAALAVAAVAARLTTHPTPAQEDDMTTPAEVQQIVYDVCVALWREPEMANILQAAAQRAVTEAAGTAVWATPVSRVAGAPTTILQDTVDGTTAALATRQVIATLPAAIIAALPVSNGNGGPAGISTADLARIATAVADEQARRQAS